MSPSGEENILFPMIMHRFAPTPSPRPSWSNQATNQASAPFTLFSRFSPVRLLFVTKLEKVTRKAEIRVELGRYRCHIGSTKSRHQKIDFNSASLIKVEHLVWDSSCQSFPRTRFLCLRTPTMIVYSLQQVIQLRLSHHIGKRPIIN